jgi:hypothetical protein
VKSSSSRYSHNSHSRCHLVPRDPLTHTRTECVSSGSIHTAGKVGEDLGCTYERYESLLEGDAVLWFAQKAHDLTWMCVRRNLDMLRAGRRQWRPTCVKLPPLWNMSTTCNSLRPSDHACPRGCCVAYDGDAKC